MKFMFSTVYSVTHRDFYARLYTPMWAPVVAGQISKWYSWTLGQKRSSYCLAP